MCGGDGGFMSVYGGETMTAGTPKDIHFNVELNSGVSKIKGFFDLFNLAVNNSRVLFMHCLTYSGFRKISSQSET